MTIIANHAHLIPEGEYADKEGDPDTLIKRLDSCGVDKTVVFPPFTYQTGGDIKDANMWALEQVEKHSDRFIAAGNMNPIADGAVELLDELYGAGVRLVKIHPSVYVHDIADPAAVDFYKRVEELGIVLCYHTGAHGTRLSYATPFKFDDLAWDYPNIKLIFEHMGGKAYNELFMSTIFNIHGRVFGGITSVLSCKKSSPWYIGIEKVEEFIERAGVDKFIFGLDFPWNTEDANKNDIKLIQNMSITQEDKDKLLGGNLCKLLQIKI